MRSTISLWRTVTSLVCRPTAVSAHRCLSPSYGTPAVVPAFRCRTGITAVSAHSCLSPSYRTPAIVPALRCRTGITAVSAQCCLSPSYGTPAIVPAFCCRTGITAVSAHGCLSPSYGTPAVVPTFSCRTGILLSGPLCPSGPPHWHFPHNTSQVPCSGTHVPGLGCKSLPASGTPPGCPTSPDHNTGLCHTIHPSLYWEADPSVQLVF